MGAGMDERAVDPGVSFAVGDGVSARAARWANGQADWWGHEAPSWDVPDALDLLTSLSMHLSPRLGSGLLSEDTPLGIGVGPR
jgi:hypothetical protein